MTVSDMKSGNFLYGPNGSGRTTISRAFPGYGSPKLKPEWHDGAEMAVRVYNRDLADQILSESNRIPGVFVLGENSVEAQKRLEQIEMPGGERAQAVEARGRALASSQSAIDRQSEAEEAFRATAWSKYRALVDAHTKASVSK